MYTVERKKCIEIGYGFRLQPGKMCSCEWICFLRKEKQKTNRKERNSMKLNNKNSFINLSIL